MSDPIRIFRCRRCGYDLDTDLGVEPRKSCRNCGSAQWEEKHNDYLLNKRDVLILRKDTGVWIQNETGETWVDRKIRDLAAIEDTERQDKAEAEFLEQLSASVDIPWEAPDA